MKGVRTNQNEHQKVQAYVLPLIVFSQFAGTSLWFAGNAIAPELIAASNLPSGTTGYLTSSVQFGFITGTLVFAIFTLADRISPVRLFAICSLVAGALNLSTIFADSLATLLISRFGVGFFLAGIYPVGMKISSDWFGKGLGKALGYLVGALVLGTAIPHLIRGYTANLPWENVLFITSLVAALGGICMFLFLKDGPLRQRGGGFDPTAIIKVFSQLNFRNAALGYFGHMWELYAMWAFVPWILSHHEGIPSGSVSFLSFAIIGAGALGCILGGYWSQKVGSARVALIALITSGICCLLSPLLLEGSVWIFVSILLIWGFSVVADSPQFSTVVAQTAPPESKGSALTIVNSIGFAITIPSIELVNWLSQRSDSGWFLLVLAIGPLLGILSTRLLIRRDL